MLWMPTLLLALAPAADPVPDYEKAVKPLLEGKCVRCHGGERTRGELDLRSRAAMLKGGENGAAISPGSAEKSLLWIHVAAEKMPPGKEKLTASEKTTLRAWIEAGAKAPGGPAPPPPPIVSAADRDFWSFKPPVRPSVPAVTGAANPIDAFLLAALDKKRLTYSSPANKAVLARRIHYALTGLPPTPEEVAAFVADARPDATARLVDKLLARQTYGERWGRHWLDVAGYADSEGILDADYVRTHAWRYRDWVVRALNADMPYDRFLQLQIAGDELTDYWNVQKTAKTLPAEVVDGLIATGFLRCASDTSRPDFVSIKNAAGYYYQTLEDTVAIVSTATMGLTLQCAKCHGHKFDPIPQREYYQTQAIFMSAYRPAQWVPQVQRRLVEATAAEQAEAAKHNASVDRDISALNQALAVFTAPLAKQLEKDRLAALPAAIRDDVRVALDTPIPKRTEVQKYLAAKFAAEIRPAGPALLIALRAKYPEFVKREAETTTAIATKQKTRVVFDEIRALYDLPGSVPTPILRRGDFKNLGDPVPPGILSMLTTPEPFRWTPPAKDAPTSGRRTAFARWLTQRGHPLTARVIVNRLWMHHFGEGLVSTPENFGRSGSAPSHPELLDWLAVELESSGWSLKHIHRLILSSRAYQQTSTLDPDKHTLALKADPDNRLLWRQRMRRLEAEALRDALLAVSGELNPEMAGVGVGVSRTGEGEIVSPESPAGKRRSIYQLVRRSTPLTILQVFDQPAIETNCTRRSVSTVSSQALTLLNSDFLSRRASAFAARVLRDEPANPASAALRLAYGREATPREKAILDEFLKTQTSRQGDKSRALADLCQMLMSANEFVYID
jgi:hypothetical protein